MYIEFIQAIVTEAQAGMFPHVVNGCWWAYETGWSLICLA